MIGSDWLAGRRATEQLLLACARARLDEPAAGRIADLLRAGEIDWQGALAAAKAHGVLPLLWRNLRQAAPELAPAAVLRRLHSDCRTAAARSLFLSAELIEITGFLAQNGIRVIPFKGPVLAASLYGSPCLREFADLDFLIHGRDAPRVVALLGSRGYSGRGEPDRRSSAQTRSHVSLIGPVGGAVIELQWDLGPRWELNRSTLRLPLDFEELWRRREVTSLCGAPLPCLSAEDLLLVLCVHGARHHWNRLVWLCDVAELIRLRRSLDWGFVLDAAGQFHCLRRMFLALLLASNLMGAEIPPFLRYRLDSDPVVPTIAAAVLRRLFDRRPGPEQAGRDGCRPAECSADLGDVAFLISVRERWRDRLRIWLRCLRAWAQPNAADRDAISLPSCLAPAYYLLRPARLVCSYGPQSALRMLRLLWAGSGWRAGRQRREPFPHKPAQALVTPAAEPVRRFSDT